MSNQNNNQTDKLSQQQAANAEVETNQFNQTEIGNEFAKEFNEGVAGQGLYGNQAQEQSQAQRKLNENNNAQS